MKAGEAQVENPRVLLVDDEPLFVLMLAEQLTESCTPVVASTFSEAEALIPQQPWAVRDARPGPLSVQCHSQSHIPLRTRERGATRAPWGESPAPTGGLAVTMRALPAELP